MGDTKKVKYTGRFGPRYGKSIRERVLEVETKQRKMHRCPKCDSEAVKRISTGIFRCKHCGTKFAGGAYVPTTMTGAIVKKMIREKKFLPMLKELLEQGEPQATKPAPESMQESNEKEKKES